MSATKTAKKQKLMDDLEEMYRRMNEWQKPYDDYPYEWTKESSRSGCPLICKIMRMLEGKS